jgi:hypothetical protein
MAFSRETQMKKNFATKFQQNLALEIGFSLAPLMLKGEKGLSL